MTIPGTPYELASEAAAVLLDRLGPHDVAMVLGSGWATAADELGSERARLTASDLPGVPAPTVAGHEGVLRSLVLPTGAGPTEVLVIGGRSHLYEGHDADTVVHLVRSAVLSGCRRVVLTNAAGSLRPEVGPGSTVLISDHLNLMGANPMAGPAPPPEVPPRFVDLTDLYDRALRDALRARRPDLGEGVYAGLLGGSFETPAEIRMLQVLGADLVGMSTVLEAIAAHHLGAEVLGLSLVTNLAAGLQPHVDHQEVLDVGTASVNHLRSVLHDVAELR